MSAGFSACSHKDWFCWPVFYFCLVPRSLTVIPPSLPNRFLFHPSIFPVPSVLPACRSLTTYGIFLSHQTLSPTHPLLLTWPDLSGFQRSEKANPLCTKPCPAAKQTVSLRLCMRLLPERFESTGYMCNENCQKYSLKNIYETEKYRLSTCKYKMP